MKQKNVSIFLTASIFFCSVYLFASRAAWLLNVDELTQLQSGVYGRDIPSMIGSFFLYVAIIIRFPFVAMANTFGVHLPAFFDNLSLLAAIFFSLIYFMSALLLKKRFFKKENRI